MTFQRLLQFALLAAVFLTPLGMANAASSKITYQGQLRESGAPVTASKTMIFGIFTSSTGGAAVWDSGAQTVSVSNGLFRTLLEPTGVNWESALYLEISVDGTTLSPREELTASPFAINSRLLQGKSYLSSGIAPASPADGDLWFNSGTGELSLWANAAWTPLSSGGSLASTPGTINTSSNPVDWTKLKNVPAGFSDGVDNTGAGALTVKENGAAVDAATANLDFLGAHFDVTSAPAGEANVALSASSVTLQGNSFNGPNQLVKLDGSGDFTPTGWATITQHMTATQSVVFGALNVGQCQSDMIPVTGARDGDTVALGMQVALATAENNQVITAFVSNNDQVTVRRCNPCGVVITCPNFGAITSTVRVDVWRH